MIWFSISFKHIVFHKEFIVMGCKKFKTMAIMFIRKDSLKGFKKIVLTGPCIEVLNEDEQVLKP